MRFATTMIVPALAGGVFASASLAVVNPFTETFTGPASNWSSSSVFTPLNYVPTGGPDGSAYGSGSFGFAANAVGDFPIMFRGQSNFASSGNAFVGDWLAAGVTTFSFSLRHNAPTNVDFFARFSNGGPGVVSLQPVLVPANTWTTFNVTIDPSNPTFIYEGGPSLYGATFTSVARVQFGIVVDAALAGQAGPYTFDVDNVSITPAPGAAALFLSAAGLVGARRRRN
jgi:MYXO-CTERM domain-containing protein